MSSLGVMLLAPLILLESREVLQGLFSLPIILALILTISSGGSTTILICAVLLQLLYFRKTASGTVRFPEYSFAFWVVCGLNPFLKLDLLALNIINISWLLIFIWAVAKSSALIVQKKREILINSKVFDHLFNDSNTKVILFSLLITYLLFSTLALIIYLIYILVWNFRAYIWDISGIKYLELGIKIALVGLLAKILFPARLEKREVILFGLGVVVMVLLEGVIR